MCVYVYMCVSVSFSVCRIWSDVPTLPPRPLLTLAVPARQVCVSYVGGTVDEDEWIPVAASRLRPPTHSFRDTTSGA